MTQSLTTAQAVVSMLELNGIDTLFWQCQAHPAAGLQQPHHCQRFAQP